MIKTIKNNYFLIIFLLFFASTKAQTILTHEVGIIIGSGSIQTDYGARNNFESTFGNFGFGIGVIHYLSFFKSNWQYPYFADHFKIRTELSYTTNKFKHRGPFVDPSKTSLLANQLRAMHGGNRQINFGFQLEYYLKNFYLNKTQQFDDAKFYPYFSVGIRYNIFKPYVISDLGDWHQDITLLPAKWQLPGAIFEKTGGTFSVSVGTGLRYRLNENWDLVTDFRYQQFFSNTVDGLNAPVVENKRKEGMFFLNFGLVYRIPYGFRY